jgi:hypothetical protein
MIQWVAGDQHYLGEIGYETGSYESLSQPCFYFGAGFFWWLGK